MTVGSFRYFEIGFASNLGDGFQRFIDHLACLKARVLTTVAPTLE